MTTGETTWVNPTDILDEQKKQRLGVLHLRIATFCSALMRLGHYNFTVKVDGNLVGEVAKVSNLPKDCRFDHSLIYADGIIHYCDSLGQIQYEGTVRKVITKNIRTVIADILYQ